MMSIDRLIAFGSEPNVYYPPSRQELQNAIEAFRTARKTLYALEYWFDTDAEILDAMSDAERKNNARMLGMVRDALKKLDGKQ